MGSVGANKGTTSTASVTDRVNSFIEELNDRNYGTSKKYVPDKQQKEYRALRREILHHIDVWGIPENGGLLIFSSGFANHDEFVHTTAKLNQYQRLVRSEAKSIKTDLSLGVITPEQAEKELYVVRSLDATIKRRRQLLKEWM